jgi:hypothetical protein
VGLGVGASPGTLGVTRANYHTFMNKGVGGSAPGRSVGMARAAIGRATRPAGPSMHAASSRA